MVETEGTSQEGRSPDELVKDEIVTATFAGRKRRRSDDFSMSPPPFDSRSIFNSAIFTSDSRNVSIERTIESPPTKRSLSPGKFAEGNITPFLVRHIPDQYAPLGPRPSEEAEATPQANSRYCYRHRPDLKCRRQADEPSMDQLQRVCLTLSP
jgi:F-box and WD-40 domain protein MET30